MACVMEAYLAECLDPRPEIICLSCCLMELGERLVDIQVRTANGIPKASYYRKQAAEFERELAESRSRPRGYSRFE